MKNIDKIKEILDESGTGIKIGSCRRYERNTGFRKHYTFSTDESTKIVFWADVIESLDQSGLETFIGENLLPALGYTKLEAVGNVAENIIELLRTGEIMPCALNTEANRDFLNTIVSREVLDLSLYYRLIVRENEENMSSVIIDDNMMKEAGITEEQLFQRAKEYVFSHMDIRCVSEILEMHEDTDLVCISFDTRMNGAGILAMGCIDETILGRISRSYPVAILPSSVDEVLLLNFKEFDKSNLCQIVEEVNLFQVDTNELLSNSIYVLYPNGQIKMLVQGKPLSKTIDEKRIVMKGGVPGYIDEPGK